MKKYQAKRPSSAMLRCLGNLAAGRDIAAHIFGQAAHGGFSGTFYALVARGWITKDGSKLTAAGRRVLENHRGG